MLMCLQAETHYCNCVLDNTKDLQEQLYKEMRGRIQEADETAPVRYLDNLLQYAKPLRWCWNDVKITNPKHSSCGEDFNSVSLSVLPALCLLSRMGLDYILEWKEESCTFV